MSIRVILVALALCGATTGCTTVDGSFAKAFGEGTIIAASYGNGTKPAALFEDAAEEVRKNNRMIKIDGPCASACAVFADFARPNVCVTDRAVFAFHKQTNTATFRTALTMNGIPLSYRYAEAQSMSDPPASADIAAWVATRGGFPIEDDYRRMLKMYAAEAVRLNFWPMCE
jgi:hypothetical protein